MIKTIVKRDGSEEDFSPNKVNQWGEWASRTLGNRVDWSSVVLHTVSVLPEKCDSLKLQEALIKTCLDYNSWSYNKMAGRLYAALLYKQIFGGNIPTVKELHSKLQDLGYMVKLDYSDDEYDEVENIINHKKDFDAAHFELDTVTKKYGIQNRKTGVLYETQQFVYMRMAMALAEDQPKYRRMQDLERWYTYFSDKKLNAPTPNYVNLGTPLRGYASCCLYTVGDNAESIGVGDHIAYTMTYMSAGIGAHHTIRSLHDPVRNGSINHLGKLGYYRSLVAAVKSNLQNGRGGAATTHYNAYDPEVETISQLKNPMSTEDKKIRGMDYSTGFNGWFVKKVAKNEDVMLFNCYTAPDLYDALYSGDQEQFEKLYAEYENNEDFPKEYVKAREIALTVLNEGVETGRAYLHFIDTMNQHTPFKDNIYSSNLCVAPETLVLTDKGYLRIESLKDQTINVWNGEEWSEVVIRKTGENQKLYRVIVAKDDDTAESLNCTNYHKWYDVDGKELRTHDLKFGTRLLPWTHPDTGKEVRDIVISVKESHTGATYCLTEPKRNMAVFNGILTGNCQEIALPTKPYSSMKDLYSEDENVEGEIALCSLAGINVPKITDDDEYHDVAYYALLMIDKCIHKSEYKLPHLGVTAKSRLNAGVGIVGLAHHLAKQGLPYESNTAKEEMHRVAELHSHALIEASLQLGKELGNAPWMDKTKWPEGWLPIDTYSKSVDDIVTTRYHYNWEDLRQRVVANGGIRNSSLVAHMPTESSSKACGTTNGLYPVRDLSLLKSDSGRISYWAAPDAEKLGKRYQAAWDVPTKDMIDCYAIFQKFCDQAISADLYRKLIGSDTIGTKELLTDFIYMYKMGLKTRYYYNTKTSNGETEVDSGCGSGGCTI